MDQQPETVNDALSRLRQRVRDGEFLSDEGPFHAEFARIQALAASELAALDAKIAEQQEFLRRRVSEKAAREALAAAGIGPQYLKVATKLFLQRHRLEIEPDQDGEPGAVAITDDDEKVTVEHVANIWSLSEDAASFRAPLAAPQHFVAQLRTLRRDLLPTERTG